MPPPDWSWASFTVPHTSPLQVSRVGWRYAEGSWLYNIAGEAYVVVPDCFAEFGGLEALDVKTVANWVARLGRHREHKSPSGKANTFRAEMADNRRVDGMVFPGDLIWDGDPPALADGALGRRRR